jgi:co-chaperonin GroES (HSP10)
MGPSKSKGGLYLPDEAVERTQLTTVVGYVLKVGDLAYADKDKFPEGPWCKAKDWVIFGRYAGSRFKIEGGEVRILNDDEIIAKIKNPEDIIHVY